MADSLSFISDDDFDTAVAELVERVAAARTRSEQRRQNSVRDPFFYVAAACVLGLPAANLGSLSTSQTLAQATSMAIGTLHQRIINSMPGWQDPNASVDAVNERRRLVAEIKNAHNTMNTSDKNANIRKLEDYLKFRRWNATGKAYLVMVLPRRPLREESHLQNGVYAIDGRSFYALASNVPDALEQVFEQLPARIMKHLPQSAVEQVDPDALDLCNALFRQVHLGLE